MSGCIRTYKIPVPAQLYPLCDELNRTAGRIYSKTLSLVRKIHKKKGFWLSEGSAKKWMLRWAKEIPVHTHSKQAFMELYFQALRSYFRASKKTKDALPPYRRKKYLPFIWKNTAIRYREGRIELSLGKRRKPVSVPAKFPEGTVFRQAKLVYENGRYYLHLAIEVEIVALKDKGQAGGVDLGVIKPIAAVFEDGKAVVYHGGKLNSLLRYRNKRLASFQEAISRTQKGSKRKKKLLRGKKKFLIQIRNQIRDVLHKITSHFIKACLERDVSTIVLGDLNGIRDRVRYSKKVNQKIHQWAFRKLAEQLLCKAEAVGIRVVKVSERNTSQECPVCGTKNKTKNRVYRCRKCGFVHHRDIVGAVNILRRYLASIGAISTVVADLAPAAGVRYYPHLRGQGGLSPWKQALSL